MMLDIHKALSSNQGTMHLETSLNIKLGAFVSVYGNSGAGKTSLLRIMAGLLTPDKASIRFGNTTWVDSKHQLRPQLRNIGFVFQDYALFPHMTVRQNLVFAQSNNVDPSFIDELLEVTNLTGLQDRKPQQLSGGQRQRTALARAIAQRPQLLLLDEPFSAMDEQIKIALQYYLKDIHHKLKMTTIMASHDREAMIRLSDEVIHLEEGKVLFQGAPEEAFEVINYNNSVNLMAEVITVKGNLVFALLDGKMIQFTSDKNHQPGDRISLKGGFQE